MDGSFCRFCWRLRSACGNDEALHQRVLAILLRGGVAAVDAMAAAGRASGSAWVEHLAATEADAVRHGSTLADAVRRIPPLSGSLPAWVQIGEASGALQRMLQHAADRLQRQWEQYVTRVLSLLEPALILLIGVFVLLVTLSILLPVISMNRAIS